MRNKINQNSRYKSNSTNNSIKYERIKESKQQTLVLGHNSVVTTQTQPSIQAS